MRKQDGNTFMHLVRIVGFATNGETIGAEVFQFAAKQCH